MQKVGKYLAISFQKNFTSLWGLFIAEYQLTFGLGKRVIRIGILSRYLLEESDWYWKF